MPALDDRADDLERENAELRRHLAEREGELREREAELAEMRHQQAGTAEVLEIISSCPGRLEPVFEAVLANALRICGGTFGMLALFDGGGFRGVASHAVGREWTEVLSGLHRPPPGTGLDRLQMELRTAQIADCAAEPAYDDVRTRNPAFASVRTALHVPMLKESELIGAIAIYRGEVRPFIDKEIELVESFAKQAVIAIQNTRLITETREALEQQTATAEVLQVINSSPGDLAPVFEAILEKAMHLCGAAFGELRARDGDTFRSAATRGVPPDFAEYRRDNAFVAEPGSLGARILAGEQVVQVLDLKDEDVYRAGYRNRRALVDLGGARTALVASLRKDDIVLGFIIVYRQEVRAFMDKQIALLQNFAAQAVIAMENARLLGELRQRTEEVAELNRGLQARVPEQVDELGPGRAVEAVPGASACRTHRIARR